MDPKTRRSFFSLLFVIAIDNFGYALVLILFAPLMLSPEYHLLPEGTSVAVRNIYLGVLFITFPLTQFLGAPILGDYADRFGRKKALYISIIGVIIGFLLSGIACLIRSVSFLIISRLFTGFFAGNQAICMSAVADISPNEKIRSKNFGIVTVAFGVSFILSMLVGGYFSDPVVSKFFNPSLPFWITAVLTLLSLIAVRKFYTETHKTKEKASFDLLKSMHNIVIAFKIKEVRPYFLVILAWNLGWGISIQWFSDYSLLEFKVSQLAITWGLSIFGLFWMLGGLLVNPLLLKRYNSLMIASVGFFFTSLFLFLMMAFEQYTLFCLMYSLSAIFSACAFSNSLNLVSINAPEEVQGKMMGISQSMLSLGRMITALLGGYLVVKNTEFLFPFAAIVLLIALLILVVKRLKIST